MERIEVEFEGRPVVANYELVDGGVEVRLGRRSKYARLHATPAPTMAKLLLNEIIRETKAAMLRDRAEADDDFVEA